MLNRLSVSECSLLKMKDLREKERKKQRKKQRKKEDNPAIENPVVMVLEQEKTWTMMKKLTKTNSNWLKHFPNDVSLCFCFADWKMDEWRNSLGSPECACVARNETSLCVF